MAEVTTTVTNKWTTLFITAEKAVITTESTYTDLAAYAVETNETSFKKNSLARIACAKVVKYLNPRKKGEDLGKYKNRISQRVGRLIVERSPKTHS